MSLPLSSTRRVIAAREKEFQKQFIFPEKFLVYVLQAFVTNSYSKTCFLSLARK
jgi:hypothetical protein